MEICLYKDDNGKCKLKETICIENGCMDRIVKIGDEVVSKPIGIPAKIVDVKDVSIFLDQNATVVITKIKRLSSTGELSKGEILKLIEEEKKDKNRRRVIQELTKYS
jgi:hypothetical protein